MNSVARWRGSNPRSRFTEAPTYIHMYIQGSGTPSTAGHLWELPWSSRVREPIARIQILGPPVSSRELWVPLRSKQKTRPEVATVDTSEVIFVVTVFAMSSWVLGRPLGTLFSRPLQPFWCLQASNSVYKHVLAAWNA
jgi:hypothetical protein